MFAQELKPLRILQGCDRHPSALAYVTTRRDESEGAQSLFRGFGDRLSTGDLAIFPSSVDLGFAPWEIPQASPRAKAQSLAHVNRYYPELPAAMQGRQLRPARRTEAASEHR
jgi:hypothetical protein